MPLSLETRRLRLGPLALEDAPALYAYRASPNVTKFQGFAPSDVSDAQAFIASSLERSLEDLGAWCQVGVWCEDTLVGDLGICMLETRKDHAEIGVTISPEHQRRGYATEAVTALLGYLFDQRHIHRVVASVDPDNLAVRALLERLRFRQEGHFRESYFFRGQWVDDVIYAMLRREWGKP